MVSNRTINARRNAVSGVINRLVGLLIPFFLRTALIKILGEEYLGLSSLFSSILQVLNLADLGFGTAIVYSMYEPIARNDKRVINALLKFYKTVYNFIGTGILVIGLCLIPFLDFFINGDYPNGLSLTYVYLIYLFNTVISYTFFAYRKTLLTAMQRSDVDNMVNSIVQVLLDILQIILLVVFKNYYMYILVTPVKTLISNFIVTIISYRMYPEYICGGSLSLDNLTAIKKRVIGLALQKFGNTISTSLDSIIISSFIGLSALAIYSNYFYIVSSIMAFAWVAISSVTAGVGNSIVTETTEKNYLLFKKLTLLNNWLIFWCVPCLLCLYQHFMNIWVGKLLMADNYIVFLFVIYFIAGQMQKIVIVYRDACGIWWIDKWRPLISCIFNLFLNIICVKFIGMAGVIISTILSYLIIDIPWETIVLFKYYFKLSAITYFINTLKFFTSLFINTFLCYLVCLILPEAGVLFFLVKGAICFIISNTLFVLFNYKTEEYTNLRATVISSLKKLDRYGGSK